MAITILSLAELLFCLLIWLLVIKRKPDAWSGAQITLFVFFVFANLIDVVQTHIAVNILSVSIEKNPLMGPEFNLFLGCSGKICLFLFVFTIMSLKFDKYKLNGTTVSKKVWEMTRYSFIITLNLISWCTIIGNMIQTYLCIYDIVNNHTLVPLN